MVTKKQTIEKIREIIDKHYARLAISILGKPALSKEEIKLLQKDGFDTSNNNSLLALAYYHNFINHPIDEVAPKSVEDMQNQQSVKGLKPQGEAHDYTIENINDKTKQLIEKMKLDVTTRIEGIIRENNDSFKMNALQNINRSDDLDELVKESTISKLKQKLKDTSKDANRDWSRIAVTELSNAVGIANVDRIISDNANVKADELYVFRITVKDAKTCKWCKRFYQDADGSPKLYKLSTLLDNGSNYGKKTVDWNPVVVATHPWERCSGIIELKPGFKLQADGSVTYMGLAKWNEYIFNKLQN